MSYKSNPPPTYGPTTITGPDGKAYFTPDWLKWFVDLSKLLNSFSPNGQVFGDIAVSTINKITVTAPTTSATLTIANGKTLTVNDSTTLATNGATFENASVLALAAGKALTATNSITLTGADGTVMTFPATNASIARIDAGQTFTGLQTANVKVASAGGNQSSDGSTGITGTMTTASLVGKTLTFKDGIIVGFA